MGPQIWSFQARTRWWICSLITLNLWSVTTVTHSMLRMSQCAVLFQSPQLRHASYLHDVHNLLQLQLHSTNGSVFFLSLLSNILQKSLPEIPIIDNLHQSAGYLKLQKEKIIEGLNVSLISVSLSIMSPDLGHTKLPMSKQNEASKLLHVEQTCKRRSTKKGKLEENLKPRKGGVQVARCRPPS